MIFRLSEEMLITISFNRFLSSTFDESDFDHLRTQKARLELLSCTTMRTVRVLVRVQLAKTFYFMQIKIELWLLNTKLKNYIKANAYQIGQEILFDPDKNLNEMNILKFSQQRSRIDNEIKLPFSNELL